MIEKTLGIEGTTFKQKLESIKCDKETKMICNFVASWYVYLKGMA